jgi:uncharacterized protein (TIGR03437 family)
MWFQPILTSFSPRSGAPGTAVTITGKDLGGLTSVTFNGTDGIINSNSETKVVVDVPSGATTGQLSVVSECCDVSFSKNFKVK